MEFPHRPEWLLEPSQGYVLIGTASGTGDRTFRPGEISVQAPHDPAALSYTAWAEISGYGPVSSYGAVDIWGMMSEEGGVAVPLLSAYQTGIMKDIFSASAALVGTPYYDIPPYPPSMTYVRANLYGYEVTGDDVPHVLGPWIIELYKRMNVGGGGVTPEPPEDAPCPPRQPWPYVDPETVPPRIDSESGRVRRSNP
jgi:hypothetical protein